MQKMKKILFNLFSVKSRVKQLETLVLNPNIITHLRLVIKISD